MGVGCYVTIAALREKIGVSRMVTRMMETILMYAKDTLTGTFEQIKTYVDYDIQTERSEWIKTANTYRITLGVSWEELKFMNRKALKKQIKEWDTQQWMEEMLNKPTLQVQWYSEAKLYIGYDNCYRNNRNSECLAKKDKFTTIR